VRSADFVYVSSGTWSLMGIETPAPLINDKTLAGNLTNEGGIGNTFRVLRNIIGLWPLQECRRHWHDYSYEELVKLAESADPFRSLVDLSSPELLSPSDMPAAISACCRGTAQPVPESPGQFTRCILESLALEYRRTLEQLIDVRNGRPVERIHIVGGGAKNSLLCQFTADACGLPVTAGPAEAAAIGNLLVQALAAGRLKDLADLRACVRRSFPGDEYEPGRDARWDEARIRYAELTRKAL
jgi:rhamnulokinase